MTTPSRLFAGAQLERAPGPKYLEALRFAEMAPVAPLPRASTLAEWRGRLPDDFRTSIVAPRPAVASREGPMRLDDELEAGLRWLLEAADALRVRAIVVPTDADTTTGQRDRDRIAAYFERIPREGRKVVWAPSGLWEPDLAQPFAARLGIDLAFDPLEDLVPEGEVVYGRLRAIGGRQRFGPDALADVVDKVLESDAREVYVAIASPRSFKEAEKLAQLAAAAEG